MRCVANALAKRWWLVGGGPTRYLRPAAHMCGRTGRSRVTTRPDSHGCGANGDCGTDTQTRTRVAFAVTVIHRVVLAPTLLYERDEHRGSLPTAVATNTAPTRGRAVRNYYATSAFRTLSRRTIVRRVERRLPDCRRDAALQPEREHSLAGVAGVHPRELRAQCRHHPRPQSARPLELAVSSPTGRGTRCTAAHCRSLCGRLRAAMSEE